MVAVAILAGALAVALGLTLGASKAWAGGQPDSPRLEDLTHKTYTISYKGKGVDSGYRQYQSVKAYSKKISNAKSSDTSVATVEVQAFKANGKRFYVLGVYVKKTGTTNISFKWGSKAYTVKYKVVPYANPVKSIKIGSKDFTKKFAPKALTWGSDSVMAGTSANSYSGKVVIKPAKGWTVKRIWCWKNASSTSPKFVKNGAKVSSVKSVWISMTKGSQMELLYIYAGGKYFRVG